MTLCPSCKTNKARLHSVYGVIPCEECSAKNLQRPGSTIEFTSESIKEQRKEFADDIEQPHHGGELNKRWLEIYGEDLAIKRGFTKKEIKNAKYTWNDLRYYKDGL